MIDLRKVVVGYDMCLYSVLFCEVLFDGLYMSGIDMIEIGLMMMLMNYFVVGKFQVVGGIQVIVSYNLVKYNGFKFSLYEVCFVFGDDGILLMEQVVMSGDLLMVDCCGISEKVDIFEDYGQYVFGYLLEGQCFKVVVDVVNGMGMIYKLLFECVGIDFVLFYFEFDGIFFNYEVNLLKFENFEDLNELVCSFGVDFGVCFDGDVDCVVFVDEIGVLIGSDFIMVFIGGEIVVDNFGKVVVYDVCFLCLVVEYLIEKGGDLCKECVGYLFIKVMMCKFGGVFGGEFVGYYYFCENYYVDCLLFVVVEVINLFCKRGQVMFEIVVLFVCYVMSFEINFEVEDKEGMMVQFGECYGDGEISYFDGISVDFFDWWFNVCLLNIELLLCFVFEVNMFELFVEKQVEFMVILGILIQ